MTHTPYHLCFETFANELRMNIMTNLLEKPMHVEELTSVLGVERSRVSHSLKMLKKCNLVTVTKDGKRSIYTAKSNTFFHAEGKGILNVINNHINHHCKECAKQGRCKQ